MASLEVWSVWHPRGLLHELSVMALLFGMSGQQADTGPCGHKLTDTSFLRELWGKNIGSVRRASAELLTELRYFGGGLMEGGTLWLPVDNWHLPLGLKCN